MRLNGDAYVPSIAPKYRRMEIPRNRDFLLQTRILSALLNIQITIILCILTRNLAIILVYFWFILVYFGLFLVFYPNKKKDTVLVPLFSEYLLVFFCELFGVI